MDSTLTLVFFVSQGLACRKADKQKSQLDVVIENLEVEPWRQESKAEARDISSVSKIYLPIFDNAYWPCPLVC